MTNEPILQCIIVLKPGLFVTGFIQNERKLSSSGSFSFSSWHTNSLLMPPLRYFHQFSQQIRHLCISPKDDWKYPTRILSNYLEDVNSNCILPIHLFGGCTYYHQAERPILEDILKESFQFPPRHWHEFPCTRRAVPWVKMGVSFLWTIYR